MSRPDPSWLTASQAAARLGIKPATLYAYVSRGLIPRRRGADGRSSFFLPADVERLAKRTPHSRLAPTDIVVPTVISFIDAANGVLLYRGVDAVDASATHRYEEVAEFLWTGRWNAPETWDADPTSFRAAQRAQRALPRGTKLIDRLGVSVSAARAADDARDDRSPEGVVRSGRNLLATLVDTLPSIGSANGGESFSARLWPRLSTSEPTSEALRLLDRLLCLGAEHGVTLSVVAARLAASNGADPYAAVASALGPGIAAISSSRFSPLETLLAECERSDDPYDVVDASVAREGRVIGVSADPYPKGDPRGRALLEDLRLMQPDRAAVVDGTADAVERRGKAEPDMTFATAAVSFALGFRAGSAELICALSRVAGWIAHAISEYRQPTPFRPHATYIGTLPPPEQRQERELLHAVWDYLRED